MPLIKSANAPASAQPFSMKDIENQAKALIFQARQRAEQIITAAQEESEALKEQARLDGIAIGHGEGAARGREEGLKAGRDAALAEHRAALTAALSALQKSISELEASRRELHSAAHRDVLELAIAIAERVTKRQGVLDSNVAVANVTEALKLVIHASDVRVAIHPSQKKTIDELIPRLQMQWPTLQHVAVIEDDTLLPGGCRVFTQQGVVDGDLNEQISRIVGDLLPEKQEALS